MKRTKRDLMKFILLYFTFFLILSLFNIYLTFHFRLSIYPSNFSVFIFINTLFRIPPLQSLLYAESISA